MTTHNGERFLREQLASLERQTLVPTELVVHDDCSSDATLSILDEFADRVPFSVTLIRSSSRRGHAAGFLQSATRCRSDLIAFCDQDDIWLPQKLALCVAEFQRGRDVLLVVHSATVVDASGRHPRGTYPSFHRRRVTTPRSTDLCPQTPGFATVLDSRALDISRATGEVPDYVDALGHDDWLPFLAASFGNVVFLPDKLVLYRQHPDSQWGAPPSGLLSRSQAVTPHRGHETRLYRESAQWAREFASQLEQLGDRVAKLPDGLILDGIAPRAGYWHGLAAASDRRSALYASRPGWSSFVALADHALRGDYGRRGRGGLGISSLCRDFLYAAKLLDPTLRLTQTMRL